MSGFLGEAARLAELVTSKRMSQDEAEETFWAYLQEHGADITRVGAKMLVTDPGNTEFNRHDIEHDLADYPGLLDYRVSREGS